MSRCILEKNRTITCVNMRIIYSEPFQNKDKICTNCGHELEYDGYVWKHSNNSYTCTVEHCICFNANSRSIKHIDKLKHIPVSQYD